MTSFPEVRESAPTTEAEIVLLLPAPRRVSQVPVMGAENEGSQPPARAAVQPATAGVAPSVTPAQFLSWKQRKVCPSFPFPVLNHGNRS